MKPSDLPALRQDVGKYLRSDMGKQLWHAAGAKYGFAGQMGANEEDRSRLLEQERLRWKLAELFYVTRDMAQLALVAGSTLPSFKLRREDLPSECGMLYYEEAFDRAATADGRRTAVQVCAWGPVVSETMRRRGVWMSFWADQRFTLDQALSLGRMTRAQVDAMAHALPRLGYDDEGIWWFDRDDDEQGDDRTLGLEGVAGMMRVIRASWLLMQQPISSIRRLQPRHSELRMMRRRKLDPRSVRIVSLRHRQTESVGNEAETREYTHRWIVRGHWRNQWYPSQGRHIPLWIHAHVKGPEGAPLLTGEIVNVWKR